MDNGPFSSFEERLSGTSSFLCHSGPGEIDSAAAHQGSCTETRPDCSYDYRHVSCRVFPVSAMQMGKGQR